MLNSNFRGLKYVRVKRNTNIKVHLNSVVCLNNIPELIIPYVIIGGVYFCFMRKYSLGNYIFHTLIK